MDFSELITKKISNKSLTQSELNEFVSSVVGNEIGEDQAGSLLKAFCDYGLSDDESFVLLDAMVSRGERLNYGMEGPIVDMPSTGGVGNITPIVVAAVSAACGLINPKMSGRSLKHTGGTIDILESIGYEADVPLEQFKNNVCQYGFDIISQTHDLAPADKKLYSLRKQYGAVESIPLIASSIISKKVAVGCNAIVVDVKYGAGSHLKEPILLFQLADALIRFGERAGIRTHVVMTNNDRPQCRKIGNLLSLQEVFEILSGKHYPQSELDLYLNLSAALLKVGKRVQTMREGYELSQNSIQNGSAREKLEQLILRHNGDLGLLKKQAKHKVSIKAPASGFIWSIDPETLNQIMRRVIFKLDPGTKKEILFDSLAGLELVSAVGDSVHEGDEIGFVHATDKSRALDTAQSLVKKTITISPVAPQVPPFIIFHQDKHGPFQVEGEGAFGLISTKFREEEKYLLQWNRRWERYNLIGGKHEPGNEVSHRNTVIREIEEELNLQFNIDFDVHSPRKIQITDFSERERLLKCYQFTIYDVKFLQPEREIVAHVSRNPDNCWASLNDIKKRNINGRPLSNTVAKILQQVGRVS